MGDTKVICFTNNKGGSGKTTACANLGYELSQLGRRVLLVDGDMQMNLTLSFFDEDQALSIAQSRQTLYEAVCAKRDLTGYVHSTSWVMVDLIPATTLMSRIEFDLFTMMQRELVLRKCLKPLKEAGTYDYILLDAPPTLGCWVVNILCASDYAIIPVEASPWGLFGLANLFEFLSGLDDLTRIKVLGVLVTRADERKKYFKQTLDTLETMQDISVFKTCIHTDAAVEWSQDASKPLGAYKPRTRSAQEFTQLAKEIDERWQ